MRRSVAKTLGLGPCLILVASTPLVAGTISLAWNGATSAAGYRVYYGLASGEYPQFRDVGPVTETTLSGLDDCRSYYVAVKAYNSAGESADFSNEVSGWSRPTVTASSPSAEQQGATGTVQLQGTNFRTDATVQINNPRVRLASTTVVDCRRIDLSVAVAPDGPGQRPAQVGTFSVTVTNGDGTYGVRSDAFEVLLNPFRIDVNRSDATTLGRVDGKDTVWMARFFGSQEPDALYDPDFDLDGDGWVDGEDLVHLATNLGRCWSGSAWNGGACAGHP